MPVSGLGSLISPPQVDFARFCQQSLALLCTVSDDGRFLWLNPAFERVLGYPSEVLYSKRVLDLLHPDDIEATRAMMALRQAGEPIENFENRYRCADGSYKWLNWSATRDECGTVYAAARDITEKKQLEAELRRLAKIAAATSNSVIITGPDRRIQWVNEGFTRLTGYTLPEVEGRKPGEILQGPDTDPQAIEQIRRGLAAAQGFSLEILNYHRSGSTYWVRIEMEPLFDAAGEPAGFMAIQLDITERKRDEIRLLESARRLSHMSQLSKVGAWQIDLVHNTATWTEETYRIHDVDLTFVLTVEAAMEFYDPATAADVRRHAQAAIHQGVPWDCEWPMTTARGRQVWVRCIGEPHFEDGRCVSINGTVQDISLERERNEQIRLSELRHRELLAALPDALLRIGPAGELLDVHTPPGFPALTSARPGERFLLPPVANAIEALLNRPDGATHECELAGGRLLELRRAPAHEDSLILARDITDRREVENRLSAAISWQTAFHDFAGFAVIATSPDGIIRSFNGAAERLLGYSASELVDQQTPAILHDPQEVEARAAAVSAELGLTFGHPFEACTAPSRLNLPNTHEWTLIRKDGSRFPVLLSVTALRDAAQGVIGYLAVGADLTQQKESARQLELARQAAEDASRAKSDFLANMSHEIRTPMNGVVGFADLLAETPLAADQREYVETIRHSAEALLSIINDILDFSKIEAGRLTLEKKTCDVRQAAVEVVELLRPGLLSSAVELVLDWGPRVPQFAVGDAGRIRQVLLNLLGNALKFTEQGSIILRAEALPRGLRIAIIDTGIGIPPEKQPSLFGKFVQVDTSSARRFGGTGLGLAISRHLVEAMDGEINFSSVLGGGSTFSVTLPTPTDLLPVPTYPSPLSRAPHLLLVDDFVPARDVLVTWCEAFGWTCAVAGSLAEAVSVLAASREPFTAVLLDSTLPDASPAGAAAQFQALAPCLPLVILPPGPSSRLEAQPWYDLGYAGILVKPVSRPDPIVRLLESLLHVAAPIPHAPPAIERPAVSAARVLLAEDNPINQTLALRLLERMGFVVDLASDGRQAVSLAGAGSYELILMDCQMPLLDGFAATVALRAAGTLTPIVALTANALPGDRERCLAAGMNDYLTKPLKRTDLERVLSRWIPAAEVVADPVTGDATL
jgi:PAS domain S-box-containing protein